MCALMASHPAFRDNTWGLTDTDENEVEDGAGNDAVREEDRPRCGSSAPAWWRCAFLASHPALRDNTWGMSDTGEDGDDDDPGIDEVGEEDREQRFEQAIGRGDDELGEATDNEGDDEREEGAEGRTS